MFICFPVQLLAGVGLRTGVVVRGSPDTSGTPQGAGSTVRILRGQVKPCLSLVGSSTVSILRAAHNIDKLLYPHGLAQTLGSTVASRRTIAAGGWYYGCTS